MSFYMKGKTTAIKLPNTELLLTELSQSVWENLDRGREYRPNAVRSVHTTDNVYYMADKKNQFV